MIQLSQCFLYFLWDLILPSILYSPYFPLVLTLPLIQSFPYFPLVLTLPYFQWNRCFLWDQKIPCFQ
jgi:hypothetical protein